MSAAPDAPVLWIADTTPIVVLAKIGALELLADEGRQVLVPSAVVREIHRGSSTDPARTAIDAGWGMRAAIRYIPASVRSVGLLDVGEQSVLAAAMKRPGSRVVLDDEQARKAAKLLGLPLIGTVGVILLAKRRNRIPAVAPLFHAVRGAGLYVHASLLQRLALTEGEAWP